MRKPWVIFCVVVLVGIGAVILYVIARVRYPWAEYLSDPFVIGLLATATGFAGYFFGPRWKQYFVGPQLTIEKTEPTPTYSVARSDPSLPNPASFFHIKIRNRRPWSPAKDVEVRILRMWLGASRVEKAIPSFQLHWQYPARDDRGMTVPREPRLVIESEICDLCGFIREGDRTRWEIPVYRGPFGFLEDLEANLRLDEKQIRLEVQAVGPNHAGVTECFEITWDGEWDDDMSKHVEVTKVLRRR